MLVILALACASAVAPAEPSSPTEPVGESTIGLAFPPPAGAVRVDGGPFGAWLATQPVAPIAAPVLTFGGEAVGGHDARVVDLPLVKGDLQQCADSAIRLRAEWERSVGRAPSFHATSGDPMPWARFEAGETPYESGGKLAWRAGSSRRWEDWLTLVFTWAGSRSLALDTRPVEVPQPGDLLVRPGSPGHVVLLLDVATGPDGTFVLVGEGYTPAMSFHVERGPASGWWRYADGALDPPWPLLAGATLRRW